ncbi:MAG: SDR family oxidoreductase, partial [Abitibacteriaceae bacterium]|nr:SDR family oxidoreductase [Abditibacteriaceae bacterium]
MRKKALLAAAGLSFGFAAREWYLRQHESSLEAQVVLITGGSRGLGLALAHEFARQGCRLAICARDAEELERARHELEQQGATVLTIQCDISDQAQVSQMIDQVTRHYDGLDILVNNAGIITAGPVENMALQDFEEAMQIMYWGVVYPTLAVLPQMQRRRSGRIVNITSIGGKIAMPHLLPYSSAKFAAVAFSEGLRAEVAKDGISVNTICPGLMRTGSYVNVNVKGQQDNEFILFSLLDNLPGISISVESAARRIVQATRRNEAEVVLSLPAKLQA